MTRLDAMMKFEELIDDIINELPPKESNKALEAIADRVKEVLDDAD